MAKDTSKPVYIKIGSRELAYDDNLSEQLGFKSRTEFMRFGMFLLSRMSKQEVYDLLGEFRSYQDALSEGDGKEVLKIKIKT